MPASLERLAKAVHPEGCGPLYWFNYLATTRKQKLKTDYCIIIVTHSMQQAARVSTKTAFMYLGELVEFDETNKIFTSPSDRRTQDYITGRFG